MEMELLSFRFTSYGFVLLCTIWSITDCSTVAPTATPGPTLQTSPGTTQPPTTSPPPEDVRNLSVVNQTETSVTITFKQVPGIAEYVWSINGTNRTEAFPASDDDLYTLGDLVPARRYHMTLFSSKDGRLSDGYVFTAATAPQNVDSFEAADQDENSITLKWTKKAHISLYALQFNGNQTEISADDTAESVEYVVQNLNSSTRYFFTLYSVFEDILSTGFTLPASTAPRNADGFRPVDQTETSITLQWEPVPGVTQFIVESVHGSKNVTGQRATISNLESGALYNFTLFAVFENINSSGSDISAPTVPPDPTNFTAAARTETNVTLNWDKVGEIQDYELDFQGSRRNVTASAGPVVTCTVPGLDSGTLYRFTVRTRFAGLRSRGASREESTVPPRLSSAEVVERGLTTITLKWASPRDDWEYNLRIHREDVTLKPDRGSVSHTVRSLDPGTVYEFKVTTVFRSTASEEYEDSTVTVIDCSKVDWRVTETSIQGVVSGQFTNATASNGSQPQPFYSSGSGGEVKFSDLYPGAKYDMTLMYKELTQCRHSLHIVPPGLKPRCKNCNNGYSVCVEWDRPSGIWDFVEIAVADRVDNVGFDGKPEVEIQGFQPAKKYKVSITTQSGTQRSRTESFTCATDARGVIAGSFFGVLLFLVLVCAVVFVMLRRPTLIRRHKLPKGGARTSARKSKRIPLEKFLAYFNKMSADENKGFSLEYEDLADVGTGQAQKAATAQENKPKNRFINVLPYDRSRVKLSASTSHSDYINASYMPGYNSEREFIAAQGPMPSTVSDFWRMIWEQRVRGVVMVTNCTEGGRTKCEQYWPSDGDARVCGDLAVFTTSQQRETDWTLREFMLKHRLTSEERTVKHFHFTAWPDHGVPDGTEVLIQFRALVRKHIQTEAEGTPTVVHCSAGVGRTGTLIALDTLLQQMDRDKVVDVNGFVQKMRLNRPHMVQTESQYVFLHQCIVDRLLPNKTQEENIYENELIYANATALRDYQDNANHV